MSMFFDQSPRDKLNNSQVNAAPNLNQHPRGYAGGTILDPNQGQSNSPQQIEELQKKPWYKTLWILEICSATIIPWALWAIGRGAPVKGAEFKAGSDGFDAALEKLEQALPWQGQWSGSAADAYTAQVQVFIDQVTTMKELDLAVKNSLTIHAEDIRKTRILLTATLALLTSALSFFVFLWWNDKNNKTNKITKNVTLNTNLNSNVENGSQRESFVDIDGKSLGEVATVASDAEIPRDSQMGPMSQYGPDSNLNPSPAIHTGPVYVNGCLYWAQLPFLAYTGLVIASVVAIVVGGAGKRENDADRAQKNYREAGRRATIRGGTAGVRTARVNQEQATTVSRFDSENGRATGTQAATASSVTSRVGDQMSPAQPVQNSVVDSARGTTKNIVTESDEPGKAASGKSTTAIPFLANAIRDTGIRHGSAATDQRASVQVGQSAAASTPLQRADNSSEDDHNASNTSDAQNASGIENEQAPIASGESAGKPETAPTINPHQ